MMMSIGGYVRRGQRLVRRLCMDPRLRMVGGGVRYGLCGLILSAASVGNFPMPLPLGALCAGIGSWPSILVALGAALGYRLFWGSVGAQGFVWVLGGLVISLALGGRRLNKTAPLLMSALAGLTVAVTGLAFLALGGQRESFPIYLLQIGLAFGSAWVATVGLVRREPVNDWLAAGLAVLALAQVAPFGFSLGYVAAGMLGAVAPFPAAALAGAALDLGRISAVPMTGVLCLCFFARLIPRLPRWTAYAIPAVVYLIAAPLCGVTEILPVVGLALGGALGVFLPPQTPVAHRRGETGMAQVRLELTAGVLAEAEQLLLETPEYPIDEAALIFKAADRACSACPCRKTCRNVEVAENMPPSVLHRPLLGTDDLPVSCRKPGRLLLELRRSQDQFRAIRADRDRQREYRNALIQQYRFLSEYLQELADDLPKRGDALTPRFYVEVAARTAGLESANGDRCLWFAGTKCQYFVLLCDGMGTGIGASEEGRTAAGILRRLLSAGYPAEYAMRTLNSLCVLRDRGGCVTVDLAQIDLQNGRTSLYKWGAAPSYLVTRVGAEKIGTAAAPPGLSVTGARETVDKLSLRRGETLILMSDGVDGEAAMRRGWERTDEPLGEMAARVLRYGRGEGADDATAAIIRLLPLTLST